MKGETTKVPEAVGNCEKEAENHQQQQ